ncbi:MAG TPA: adenylate/guanylate cyclase domain-containing protein [Opitutaceae bacterium]|nr:adenylate/guanylate cyclase domain-containing protein [Opitutaceae bacterium]
MSFRFPRFRHFGSRLLVLIVGLVALAQCANYIFVVRENHKSAVERIHVRLEQGALIFKRRTNSRLDDLWNRAVLMARDYSIRQLLRGGGPDPAAVRPVLEAYSARMNVPFMALLSADGARIGDTGGVLPASALRPFQELVKRAGVAGERRAQAFAHLPTDGADAKLYVLLVAPICVQGDRIASWIGLALPMDHGFATDIKEDARLEVTFFFGKYDAMLPVESTLPEADAKLAALSSSDEADRTVKAGGNSYLTVYRPLPLITAGHAAIALQRSLESELEPDRLLERFLRYLSFILLAAAALLAVRIARNLSDPLRELAAHTEVIARGDYSIRLKLERADEIGQLATSFNRMSEGLAERDQVRDLLDKNLSPEIAAQLMTGGGAMGGEELEVTVLFVDLRNFTRLSESLPPREVLALLNRYFDRMSVIVEIYLGVVDKYMGDAIMALFGAPVAHPNHADSAMLAALEMKSALARLNAELATEGRAKLAFGIGINTSKIIAGNIGSSRRLNYSVLGDGVNVAARLQDLTRMSQYRADILVSAATLKAARGQYRVRPLGAAPVRGRDEPVEIFSLEGME